MQTVMMQQPDDSAAILRPADANERGNVDRLNIIATILSEILIRLIQDWDQHDAAGTDDNTD